MTPKPIEISVLMPALDEEADIVDAVERTLAAFRELGIEGEVIVVDDGSTDGTRARVEEIRARSPCVRLIHHERPEGIGACFWDALDQARGEAVCMIPGDNENDPAEILRYRGLLDHVDVVVPFVFNRETRSRFRNTVSNVYRGIVNVSFGVHFRYTNGTILCRASLLRALGRGEDGFFFATDIFVRLAKSGYLYAEVPCCLGRRAHGRSRALRLGALVEVAESYTRLLWTVHVKRERMPVEHVIGSRTQLRRSRARE